MKAVARTGDKVTGLNHGCDSETECRSSKSSITINGEQVHFVGGRTESHTRKMGKKCKSHSPTLSSTETKVFVEGAQIAKVGDSYPQCGKISKGSPNVFVT